MSEPKEPLTNFQRLARAAQKYARTFGQRDAAAPPPGKTAVAALREKFAAAEDALAEDLALLASAAMEEARRERVRIARDLSDRERECRDTAKVRESFAKAAEGWDWRAEYKDRRDFIGPFTLEYAPGNARVVLGRIRLRSLDHPTGEEVFAAVKAERSRLEEEARTEWPAIKQALLGRQQTPEDTVTWKVLVGALSGEAPLRRREGAVLFALALVREGFLEPGWTLSTRPPSLAHQKESLSLPRIDRPGSPDKIYALRVDRA